MRVGFIGLGVTGLPMLENLAEKGDLDLLAFDRAAEPLRRLDAHPSFGGSLRVAPRRVRRSRDRRHDAAGGRLHSRRGGLPKENVSVHDWQRQDGPLPAKRMNAHAPTVSRPPDAAPW